MPEANPKNQILLVQLGGGKRGVEDGTSNILNEAIAYSINQLTRRPK